MAVAGRLYDNGQYYSRVLQEDEAAAEAAAIESDDEVDSASAAALDGDTDVDGSGRGLLWSTFSASDVADSTKHGAAAAAADSSGRRNLLMLFRVFFVRGLLVDKRWVFPLLLAVSAGAYEAVAATILDVIGDFYMAISSLDAHLFLQVRYDMSALSAT